MIKRSTTALIKKNFLSLMHYKISVSIGIFFPVLVLAVFCIGYSGISGKTMIFDLSTEKRMYFEYAMTGLMFSMWVLTFMRKFYYVFEKEKSYGTLETLLAAPPSIYSVVFSIFCWSALYTFVETLPAQIFIFWVLKINLTVRAVALAGIVTAFTLAVFASLSLFLAAFILLFENGTTISALISYIMRILGDCLIPLSLFPVWLKKISMLLPITPGMTAFRGILLENHGMKDVLPQIAILALYFAVMWTVGSIVLKYALNEAKKEGSLGRY